MKQRAREKKMCLILSDHYTGTVKLMHKLELKLHEVKPKRKKMSMAEILQKSAID